MVSVGQCRTVNLRDTGRTQGFFIDRAEVFFPVGTEFLGNDLLDRFEIQRLHLILQQ